MDEKSYSKVAIDKFMNENLFFKDAKLKKYFDRNEQRDLGKFRQRLHDTFSENDIEKMVYVVVTDSIRDIILDTIGELTQKFKSSGDLIVSGGEAFNLYVDFSDRIVTTDIDAKFVPFMKTDTKYFGKLQALKLLLWDTLGKYAKNLNARIKKRILSFREKHSKLFKFMGIGFSNSGPYITRRYTLIKKKKSSLTNQPSKSDVFIDVELFALDLNIRFFSPASGRIQEHILGGILDIPFMRPNEFGYEVAQTKRRGIVYRNAVSGKMINNQNIYIASKEFLAEDIYLMQKLKLRPEKKIRDRLRLVQLGKMFDKRVTGSDSMDTVFKKIKHKLKTRKTTSTIKYRNVNIQKAKKVDPRVYKKYTTEPSKERLSKQFVHGLKPVTNNMNVEGYNKSHGNQRFNLENMKWKNVTNNAYIKNEFPLRPIQAKTLPKNLNISKTLYGHNPNRNKWISKKLLNDAAAIPFIGLKK
tara:strand:- start:4009 stop:5418 length:1410 start_codon:yes stop_codon:yes gene_type:complete